jgi:hypothetical protein
MSRPRSSQKNPFKGINRVRKKVASGKVETYYYAYKGGPRLAGEYGSAEFIAAFVAAGEARKKPRAGPGAGLQSLLDAYQSSAEFSVRQSAPGPTTSSRSRR